MHRTQISLDRAQYERLTREARRQGVSMSELIRRLVHDYLERKCNRPEKDPVEEVTGIAEGTGEYVGRRHDRFLYGKND